MTQKNQFQLFHDSMRALCQPREFYKSRAPYIRPKNPDEIKGKKNIRAAKRARVRLMKEAQAK